MDTIERPIVVPAAQVIVHRASWRQVFRQRRPLAPGGENIHHPVDDSPHINGALVASWLGAWDQPADDGPLFVRQVARITQLAAVIPSPILLRPHGDDAATSRRRCRITTDSTDSHCSRTDTQSLSRSERLIRFAAQPSSSRTVILSRVIVMTVLGPELYSQPNPIQRHLGDHRCG